MPSPMTELKELVETKFDFLSNMGLKVLSLEPNRVKLMLPMKGNENHLGILWAGALFTLAEVPGGILVYSTFDTAKFYPIVKEMNIKFLKPGDQPAADFCVNSDKITAREHCNKHGFWKGEN